MSTLSYARLGLKSLWRLIFVLVLLFSITMNIAAFMGWSLFTVVSGVVTTATGVQSALAASNSALKSSQLAQNRIAKQLAIKESALKSSRRANAQLVRKIDVERQISRKLKADGAKLSAAVLATSDRVYMRSTKSAGRALKTAAGKALPMVGIGVVAYLTYQEVEDLCETMEDLHQLRGLASPTTSDGQGRPEVCAVEVPTAAELAGMVTRSPQATWEALREVVPDLEDIQGIDWSSYSEQAQAAFSSAVTWTGDTAEGAWYSTVDAATDAAAWTADTAGDAYDGAISGATYGLNWFWGNEQDGNVGAQD